MFQVLPFQSEIYRWPGSGPTAPSSSSRISRADSSAVPARQQAERLLHAGRTALQAVQHGPLQRPGGSLLPGGLWAERARASRPGAQASPRSSGGGCRRRPSPVRRGPGRSGGWSPGRASGPSRRARRRSSGRTARRVPPWTWCRSFPPACTTTSAPGQPRDQAVAQQKALLAHAVLTGGVLAHHAAMLDRRAAQLDGALGIGLVRWAPPGPPMVGAFSSTAA